MTFAAEFLGGPIPCHVTETILVSDAVLRTEYGSFVQAHSYEHAAARISPR